VRQYNTELKTIPGRWWAALLYPDAKEMAQFQADETAAEVPKVDFGTSNQ
jgi:LemA protein